MTLIPLSGQPNPTLKGHKLFMLGPWPVPDSFISRLGELFPDLQVAVSQRPFMEQDPFACGLGDDDWRDVTMLLAATTVPDPDTAPKMQYVQLVSAGANHMLHKPLFEHTDVALCTANGVHGPQISEWILMTFMAFNHRLPAYLEFQRQGKWNRLNDNNIEDTVGLRVGILGYGAIGRQTARVATAMGMDVHAYTLHPRPTPASRRDNGYSPAGLGDPEGAFPSRWFSGTSTADLHAFLASGLDLMVIALPLTDQTRGLIGRPEFEAMRAKATFVSNVGRGPIVKTDDLVDALEEGVIRGAALDVTDPEPLPDGHRLFGAKNLILTPHVSGASTAYAQRVNEILELNLTRISEGKDLVNRVSRKEGY